MSDNSGASQFSSLMQNCVLHYTGEHVAATSTAKTITTYGDAKQILPFRGAGVAYFDGSDDYLVVPSHSDFTFGANPFTIECWIYPTEAKPGFLFNRRETYASKDGFLFYFFNDSKLWFHATSNGTSWNVLEWSSAALTLNQWHHVAISRDSSNIRIFINGSLVYSVATTATLHEATSTNLQIVSNVGDPTYSDSIFKGYISEYRVSNIARYTSSFTPPKYKFTPDANTKLLLHFTPTGTTFTDSSPSPKTVTRYGDAYCLTSPVTDGGVVYFDGSGDYLTSVDNSDWYLGSDNFTIETWINFKTLPTAASTKAGAIIIHGSGWSGNLGYLTNWYLQAYDTTLMFTWYNAQDLSCSYTWTVDTWYHIACVRNGTTLTLYVNGNSVGTKTISGSVGTTSYPLKIATSQNGSTATEWYLNASYAELRISKGIARYTTTFTPPTQPFTPDSYTKLLLHFWNNTAPTTFIDSSGPVDYDCFPIIPSGVTVTNNGTFTKDDLGNNKSVLKFDGSTNYISVSTSTSYNFGSDPFSISLWFKRSSLSDSMYAAFCQQVQDGSNWWSFYFNNDTNNTPLGVGIQFYSSGSSIWNVHQGSGSVSSWSTNTWYHLVLVKSGTTTTIYCNGSPLTLSSVIVATPATLPTISGPITINCTGSNYWNGNIKDLMIYKGRALTVPEIKLLMNRTHPITGRGLIDTGRYYRLS